MIHTLYLLLILAFGIVSCPNACLAQDEDVIEINLEDLENFDLDSIDFEVLEDVVSEKVRDELEIFEAKKETKKLEEELQAGFKLDLFIDKWVTNQSYERKADIHKKVDQKWEDLQTSPVQPEEYYLRDYTYNIQKKEIQRTGIEAIPFKATVTVRETLYVERTPLLVEPRAEERFTALVDTTMKLEYAKSSDEWSLQESTTKDKDLLPSWPANISKKISQYFIPRD